MEVKPLCEPGVCIGYSACHCDRRLTKSQSVCSFMVSGFTEATADKQVTPQQREPVLGVSLNREPFTWWQDQEPE